MRYLLIVLLVFNLTLSANCQNQDNKTKNCVTVISIDEKADYFYIIASDNTDKGKTKVFISIKEQPENRCKYKRIKLNQEYQFEVFSDQAPTGGDFKIRVGDEVIWRFGDDISLKPNFIVNSKGLLIPKGDTGCRQ